MSTTPYQPNLEEDGQDVALRRLVAAGLDPIIPRADVRAAVGISYPTISRLQRSGGFPSFVQVSPGRVGLHRSTLDAFLSGRRDWATRSDSR